MLSAIVVALLLVAGCHRSDAGSSLSANSFMGGSDQPTMLAAYLPWFGQPGHINVGYSSQDRVVIEKQIDEAKQLGIAAFVVNWYGQHHAFEDTAYTLMQQAASEKQFKVAIMYDEDDSDPAGETDVVLSDLKYAYDRYIGPQAVVPRDAYLQFQDRPVIFIFPKGGKADWARIRQTVSTWENPPLLIYKDVHPELANDFDGFYAWVNPGQAGLAAKRQQLGTRLSRQLLQDHGHAISQQDCGGRGVAGLQRLQGELEPEPQNGCALRPDLQPDHAHVPPLLLTGSSTPIPDD